MHSKFATLRQISRTCGDCAYCEHQQVSVDMELPVCRRPNLVAAGFQLFVCADAPACKHYLERFPEGKSPRAA